MSTDRKSPKRRLERICPWASERIDANLLFTRHTVAAVSLRPRHWDKAQNADRMEAFFRKAARRKPALILAPEGMLEGYVISDVIWHRERAEALVDIAEPLDGPYIRRFRRLAGSLKTCLCFGFAERVGREVFNSAIFIDHRGRICGTHHKLTETTHPTWHFWRQSPRIRAFDTPLGRCGVLICSDRWFAILARTLAMDGAQFLLIPAFGTVARSQTLAVLARSRENGLPVVQANVGMNMIISKGEIARYTWGADRITVAPIEIPVRSSAQAIRALDREFRRAQLRMQPKWHRATMARVRKGRPSRDEKRLFLSEREFRRLQATKWGAEDH